MHGLVLGKQLSIIVCCCLIIAVSAFLIIFNNKQKNPKNIDKIDNQISFNKNEQKIIDMIYKKLNIYDSFDKNNLKSFKITGLKSFGYYESTNNIHYIIIEYYVVCNDNTYNCDNLAIDKKYSIENEQPFIFWIKADIINYDYIERIDGVSVPIDSDWVSTNSKIE